VRWKNRVLEYGYGATECEHRGDRERRRERLHLVVMHSYRGEGGRPTHETIWRPGVGINTCCLDVPLARYKFWAELEERLSALKCPPLSESSGAFILDHLEWFRAEVAKMVRPLDDAGLADLMEAAMHRLSAEHAVNMARSAPIRVASNANRGITRNRGTS